jgi:RNA polymerase sigma-70 factor, ECF subfamily
MELRVELSSVDGAPCALDIRDVFAREGDYVYATLRRLGVRASELEDGIQEVFIAVHKHRHMYDPSRAMRPWLFGFALRIASNRRRAVRRRRESEPPPGEPVDERPRADALLESRARQNLLLSALATLDDERRAVLVLHDLDGVSVPEIARTLEIPLNTAYSRLRIAREEITVAVRRLVAKGKSQT